MNLDTKIVVRYITLAIAYDNLLTILAFICVSHNSEFLSTKIILCIELD